MIIITLVISAFLVGSISAAEISLNTLTLNGAAQITTTADGEVLRLVSANKVGGQSGTAFTTGTVDTNTFSTSFSFRITESGGEGGGADGLMFILQKTGPSVVGAEGGFFGYQNHFSGPTLFPNSLGVEFDSYPNSNIPGINESIYQHVGIDTKGYVDSLVLTSDIGGSLKDGLVWYSWIDYNGTTLEVRLNQSGIRPDIALLAFDINLKELLGSNSAYAGFGAGVGSGFGNHDILSWDYSASAAPVPEPSTMLLLGIGLVGLIGYGRKKWNWVRRGEVKMKIAGLLIKNTQSALWIIFLVSLFIPSSVIAAPIVFNDGQTHIVRSTSYQFENYKIYNNIAFPHNPTTVIFDIQSPADAAVVDIYGNSIMYVQNGNVSGIKAYDKSIVVMNGGATGTSHDFQAYSDTKVIINAGNILLGGFGGDKIVISGGFVFGYHLGGHKALIYGGIFSPYVIDFQIFNSEIMKIYGGDFISNNILLMSPSINIYGGNWFDLNVIGNVTVHGRDFTVPHGTYTASDCLNNLSGTLTDGSPLNVPVSITGSGTLTVVPEPSTLLLLGSGLVGLVGFGRKKFKK